MCTYRTRILSATRSLVVQNIQDLICQNIQTSSHHEKSHICLLGRDGGHRQRSSSLVYTCVGEIEWIVSYLDLE